MVNYSFVVICSVYLCITSMSLRRVCHYVYFSICIRIVYALSTTVVFRAYLFSTFEIKIIKILIF